MTTLGTRIRELRLKTGLTQTEFAKGIMTPSMQSQIESDRARPSFNVLARIADRLGVPMDELLVDIDMNYKCTGTYKMAKGLVNSRQYATAILLLENLLETPNPKLSKFDLQLDISRCYLELEQYDKAEQHLKDFMDWASFQHDHENMLLGSYRLAQLAWRKKDYTLALYHTLKAKEELDQGYGTDPATAGPLLTQLAAIYQSMGRSQEAIRCYEQALAVHENHDDLEARGNLYLTLAQAYSAKQDYKKADSYANQAMVLLQEVETKENVYEWKRQLIMLTRSFEHSSSAIQELLDLATYYEKKDEKTKAAVVYVDLATIYCEQGKEEAASWDEAWGYAEKARLVLPHDHSAMGDVYRVLALVYFTRGLKDKGERYFDNAVTLYQKHEQLSKLQEFMLQACCYLENKGEESQAMERLKAFQTYMVQTLQERGVYL